ncbi:MAG: DUF819 family protein [Gemmatimonadetes bacterium]|nr:DUF819 family protein [Gemmatimonadota bacterium]
MISDPLAIFAVLAIVVYGSIALEGRYRFFRSLGSALVGILIAMLLSNTGVLPGESPTYEFLMGTGVSIAIAFILLGVDLNSIRQAGPRMLAAFGIGAAGTLIGSILGGMLMREGVGPETWKLAGQYAGTYTGGGMNFAALGRAFDTSSDLFTAATAADVIVTAMWMSACLLAPVILRRRRNAADTPRARPGHETVDSGSVPLTLERALYATGKSVPIVEAAAIAAIAVASVWFAEWLGAHLPSIPGVLWLTTVVLIVAQVPAVKRLTGAAMFGNYLLLLFLASNGARSVVARIIELGPSVFIFALITVVVHGVILFGIGRLLRIDLATLAVASQANVGGAASAIALASARGYADQLLPGVAVGLLGYAVGNYAGFAAGGIVRAWMGL